jgi:cytochrome c oxidase subunit 2
MKRNWKWIMLAVLLMLALAGCGGNGNGGASDGNGGSSGGDGAASGQTHEVTIDATNFEFSIKEIRVKQGDTVKLTLNNAEGFHALKVEGYNKEVQGGKTISFVADKKGEFDYVCSVFCGTGHEEMVGKLIVE